MSGSAPVWTRGLETRLPWMIEFELSLVGGRVAFVQEVGANARILESGIRVPSGEEGARCDFTRLTVVEAPTWIAAPTRLDVAVLPPGGEPFLLGSPLESFGLGATIGEHDFNFSAAGNIVAVVMTGASVPEASAGRVRVKLSGSRVF